MAKRAVKYAVIDAFTDTPFKGNPAAVCFLEDEDEGEVDEEWLQSVAKEFNISQTAFLTRIPSTVDSPGTDVSTPRFNLRWFTPMAEVKLCGHGTLAAAHFLITSGMANSDMIEFVTKSGLLTAKKVHGLKHLGISKSYKNGAQEDFSIELDFPMIAVVKCDSMEVPSVPNTLNGLSMVNVQKTATGGDLIVELASGEDVANIQPNFDELQKCPGRGVIITGPAPPGSGFDFFSRFFCPKLGINEDPVCGSAHCALAPYWSKKLGKHSLVAYMASPRGGRLDLQLEEETQRVRIKGAAVTVMVLSQSRLCGEATLRPSVHLEGYGHYLLHQQMCKEPLEEMMGQLMEINRLAANELLESKGLSCSWIWHTPFFKLVRNHSLKPMVLKS